MSIRSMYSDEEISQLTTEEYMSRASFDDILQLDLKTFEVGALIRESTCSPEQLKAFEVQKDMILKMIEEKPQFRLKAGNIFEDKGKSGLQAKDRPGFQLMKQKAMRHEFDLVVVDAVSRLARNIRELHDVIDDFRALGIGILIMKERYWTYNMTPNDVLRLAIDGGMAQAESMTTGIRVGAHMLELAKSGQLLGGDMFGYRLKKATDVMGNPKPQDNLLIQEPIEAYIVKYIFEKFGADNPDEALTSSSLCKDLIDNNMRTFKGDLNWTPSKVIRVLDNTKYMGYQLVGKSKVVDTVSKKKVLTHVEPVRDVFDAQGNIIQKGNLIKINCEPIVSEKLWWKVHDRKMSRSAKGSENIKGRKSGLRISSDTFGRKAFCSCGYCLSRQYTHVATETKPAMYRYKCRWQVDHANKYTIGAAEKADNIICENDAVSDAKAWICEKEVFKFLFKNGKEAVMQALDIIERSKAEEQLLEDGKNIQQLQEEFDKLRKRLKKYQDMYADDLMSLDDLKNNKVEIDSKLNKIEELISNYHMEAAKQEKKSFDMQAIKDRLNTYINLKEYKVSEEMIDMFVERVIYRGVVNGNDEFLWVMNLSGEISDTSAKYRIRGYNKEYADSLKDDKNFNIVARMLIPLEECKRYCEEEAHRMYKKNNWRPITLKIAIV